MTEKPYLIGVDVSIQDGNNGLALYDTRAKQYLTIRSMSLGSLIGEISDMLTAYGIKSDDGKTWTNVAVVIENAEIDSVVFGAWQAFEKNLKKHLKGFMNWRAIEKEFRATMKAAQGIGMQKAAARIIVKGVERLGVEVIQVAPSWRERADVMKKKGGLSVTDISYYKMPTKTTSEQFNKLTGYTERTNEHGRDAATLLHGQTIERLRVWEQHMMLTSKGTPDKFRKAMLEKMKSKK